MSLILAGLAGLIVPVDPATRVGRIGARLRPVALWIMGFCAVAMASVWVYHPELLMDARR
ncbi:MAG: hypothetical protein IV086_08010 [Hyphomonadaceae bacterium]|nr:hypothetical protein [Hyphomonadaceae bacterium]